MGCSLTSADPICAGFCLPAALADAGFAALRFTIGVIVAPPRGVILIHFILSIAAIGAFDSRFASFAISYTSGHVRCLQSAADRRRWRW